MQPWQRGQGHFPYRCSRSLKINDALKASNIYIYVCKEPLAYICIYCCQKSVEGIQIIFVKCICSYNKFDTLKLGLTRQQKAESSDVHHMLALLCTASLRSLLLLLLPPQEFSFPQVWCSNQQPLHCAFSLERYSPATSQLSCKISVRQVKGHEQILQVYTAVAEVRLRSCGRRGGSTLSLFSLNLYVTFVECVH